MLKRWLIVSPPRDVAAINPIPSPFLPFVKPPINYHWRRFCRGRDIFRSWVVVVIDLKAFDAHSRNILSAILREVNVVVDDVVCSFSRRKSGSSGHNHSDGDVFLPQGIGMSLRRDDDISSCGTQFNAGDCL